MNRDLRHLISTILLLSFSLTKAQISFNGGTGIITDNQNWINFTCNVSGLNPANINTTYGFEKLTISISHNNVSDLEIHLLSPDGTDVLILNNVGGSGNNFTNTGFKNTYTTPIASGTAPFSGSYKPQGDLGLFNNGQIGNGTWTLRIRDNDSGFQGTVTGWQIRFGNGPAIPTLPFTTNLPIVKINTGGAGIPDDPKIPAVLQIVNNNSGNNAYADTTYEYEGLIGIEQRGSSSGSADKKSYGFETWDQNQNDIDTTILGMPSQSDWILSASYYDKTLMRNVLSYKLFNDMSHYASRTKYCEVFLNGEYKGVYIMMEKIKRDENRVDIAKLTINDNSGDQLTGGYIIKIDKFTGSGGQGFQSNYPPSNPSGDVIFYQLEYPSADSITQQQGAYLVSYVDSFEAALFGPNYQDPVNGFRRFAGERTFMDFMFINEMSKNVDGYRLSTYFCKDKQSNGGKLKAGPVWDYDISWMNADYGEAFIDTGWAYNLAYIAPGASVPAHWERMMSDPLFRQRVRCRWSSLRQTKLHTDTIFAFIDSTVAYINAGQQRNFVTWPIIGQPTWPQPQPLPQSYAEEIQRLKTWITNRFAWLDGKILAFPVLNLSVNLGADTALCNGNIVTLYAGQYENYVWSNGLNVGTINIANSGTYTVTVSDDFGCSGTDNIDISFEESPLVYLGNDTTICAGNTVILDAGAHSAYNWSNGDVTQTTTINTQGNYNVTVTNNNCTSTDAITIDIQVLPDATFTATPQTNSTYIFTGTNGNYAHTWDFGNGMVSFDAAPVHDYGNVNGTYTITHTVSDNLGCTATEIQTITVQSVGLGQLEVEGINIYPNPATNVFHVITNTVAENIVLTDVLGKILYTVKPESTNTAVNTGNYPAGTYIIHIYTLTGTHTTKVLKQ